jgi:hypothetical protein
LRIARAIDPDGSTGECPELLGIGRVVEEAHFLAVAVERGEAAQEEDVPCVVLAVAADIRALLECHLRRAFHLVEEHRRHPADIVDIGKVPRVEKRRDLLERRVIQRDARRRLQHRLDVARRHAHVARELVKIRFLARPLVVEHVVLRLLDGLVLAQRRDVVLELLLVRLEIRHLLQERRLVGKDLGLDFFRLRFRGGLVGLGLLDGLAHILRDGRRGENSRHRTAISSFFMAGSFRAAA